MIRWYLYIMVAPWDPIQQNYVTHFMISVVRIRFSQDCLVSTVEFHIWYRWISARKM